MISPVDRRTCLLSSFVWKCKSIQRSPRSSPRLLLSLPLSSRTSSDHRGTLLWTLESATVGRWESCSFWASIACQFYQGVSPPRDCSWSCWERARLRLEASPPSCQGNRCLPSFSLEAASQNYLVLILEETFLISTLVF